MSIPVILDTDIGFDVDDVWALAFLLACPELDVKLITTSTGDTRYRAALVAKLLQIAGREDIPIGIGIPLDDIPATHAGWLDGFSTSDYAGEILRDGVGAICEVADKATEQVALIAIGPVPNIAAALMRDPNLSNNARFVGMHGSIYRGYLGADKPMREYNVKTHPLSCQSVFAADWEKIIAPLDTCGTIMLEGDRFARVSNSDVPLTQATLENHHGWFEVVKEWPILREMDPQQQSSVLYDCLAVYLAFGEDFVELEELPVSITPDGKTLVDSAGPTVKCATNWRDKEGFLDFLVDRLVG
ncbi:MAG: nucleoside hydrolase [Pseudomonadota bacterium]